MNNILKDFSLDDFMMGAPSSVGPVWYGRISWQKAATALSISTRLLKIC
jgi:hypothetical protein